MFVILDGIDGCGKSTQAKRLVTALSEGGPPGQHALHLREPGSTQIGERVRTLLLDRTLALGPEVETLLFAAARRQMLDELVRPALQAGRDVVCERFHPSTFAYQAVAGDLEPDAVLTLLHQWACLPAPDLILIFNLPVRVAMSRRGASRDRIEDKGEEYMRRVAEGYRLYAKQDPLARVIDADKSPVEVAGDVLATVEAVRTGGLS